MVLWSRPLIRLRINLHERHSRRITCFTRDSREYFFSFSLLTNEFHFIPFQFSSIRLDSTRDFHGEFLEWERGQAPRVFSLELAVNLAVSHSTRELDPLVELDSFFFGRSVSSSKRCDAMVVVHRHR